MNLRDFFILMYWAIMGKLDDLPVEFENDTSMIYTMGNCPNGLIQGKELDEK